jgi:hypothetical protein
MLSTIIKWIQQHCTTKDKMYANKSTQTKDIVTDYLKAKSFKPIGKRREVIRKYLQAEKYQDNKKTESFIEDIE